MMGNACQSVKVSVWGAEPEGDDITGRCRGELHSGESAEKCCKAAFLTAISNLKEFSRSRVG